MGQVIAILPTLPPDFNRVEVPDSMKPEDQAKLLHELSGITTAITRTEVQAEEREKAHSQRFRSIDARIRKLEAGAEDTGEQRIEELQAKLAERKADAIRWKWWILSIASTLITSAIVGLVVYYLSTR